MPRKRKLCDCSVPHRRSSDGKEFDGSLASADVTFTNADAPAAD